MPPTYLLPVITTKEQIGLSNITNDLQLKKDSNLSDINDVNTARDNLGLGDSATKNVGSGADNIAAGNHNHDGDYADISHNHNGVYEPVDSTILKEADVDDTPINGAMAVPVSSNWAFDYAADNALVMQGLKGISLTQTDLLYMYNHNTKLIATCESSEAWADGCWNPSLGDATYGNDATNYKVGSQAISITSTSTSVRWINNDFADLDLTKFRDGSTSADTDYIEFSVYCADVSHIDDAGIEFYCDTYSTRANIFAYLFNSSLANGWNHIKIAKSAFSESGSPDWNSIKGIGLRISSGDGTSVVYTVDAIRMTRKDPDNANPNPFQFEDDGIMERIFEIASGTVFLGYDGSTLVTKGMENTQLISDISFANMYMKISIITTATTGILLEQGSDANNRNGVMVLADELKIHQYISGSESYIANVTFAVDVGDVVDMYGSILGNSLYTHASKTGSKANVFATSGADYSGNHLRMFVYEDVAVSSFVASSSSLMVR